MPGITIVFGVLLILVGVVGYFGTGRQSATALIPSYFGVVFIILGAVAGRGASARKHAMHVAALLALLALIFTAKGIPAVIRLMRGVEVDKPEAAIARTVTALLSLAFLVLCVNSFIQARRRRLLTDPAFPVKM